MTELDRAATVVLPTGPLWGSDGSASALETLNDLVEQLRGRFGVEGPVVVLSTRSPDTMPVGLARSLGDAGLSVVDDPEVMESARVVIRIWPQLVGRTSSRDYGVESLHADLIEWLSAGSRPKDLYEILHHDANQDVPNRLAAFRPDGRRWYAHNDHPLCREPAGQR